jgi:hypothetical protein
MPASAPNVKMYWEGLSKEMTVVYRLRKKEEVFHGESKV